MNTFIEIKPTYDFTDFFHFAKKNGHLYYLEKLLNFPQRGPIYAKHML